MRQRQPTTCHNSWYPVGSHLVHPGTSVWQAPLSQGMAVKHTAWDPVHFCRGLERCVLHRERTTLVGRFGAKTRFQIFNNLFHLFYCHKSRLSLISACWLSHFVGIPKMVRETKLYFFSSQNPDGKRATNTCHVELGSYSGSRHRLWEATPQESNQYYSLPCESGEVGHIPPHPHTPSYAVVLSLYIRQQASSTLHTLVFSLINQFKVSHCGGPDSSMLSELEACFTLAHHVYPHRKVTALIEAVPVPDFAVVCPFRACSNVAGL